MQKCSVESAVPRMVRPNSDGHITRDRPRPPSRQGPPKWPKILTTKFFWKTSVTYLIDYPNEIEKWKIFGLDAGG